MDCRQNSSGEISSGEFRDALYLQYRDISSKHYKNITMFSIRPMSLWQQCMRTIAESIMQHIEMCLGDSMASENYDICQMIVSHVNVLRMPEPMKRHILDEIVSSEHFRMYFQFHELNYMKSSLELLHVKEEIETLLRTKLVLDKRIETKIRKQNQLTANCIMHMKVLRKNGMTRDFYCPKKRGLLGTPISNKIDNE